MVLQRCVNRFDGRKLAGFAADEADEVAVGAAGGGKVSIDDDKGEQREKTYIIGGSLRSIALQTSARREHQTSAGGFAPA